MDQDTVGDENDRLLIGETSRVMRREQLDQAKERNKVESSIDFVNHPPHYTEHPSGVECIQITRHMSFDLGNAMKYIWRAGNKQSEDEAKDISKAIWYLQDHLKLLNGDI